MNSKILTLRNLFNSNNTLMQRSKTFLVSQQYRNEFEKYFPKVLNKIAEQKLSPPEVTDRIIHVTELRKGDENRFCGSLVLHAFETLTSGRADEKTKTEIFTLAWGADMVQTHFKILDEVTTYGTSEKGTSVWRLYDTSLYRSFAYELLKSNIENCAEYVNLFDKAFFDSAIGLYLDDATRRNCNEFTPERYKSIVTHKTALPMFSFPLMLAMKLNRNVNEKSLEIVGDICADLGFLYQMQKDYLASYGKEVDDMGIPTHSEDIKNGKCTWLAITALQRCTASQKIVLSCTYGSKSPSHIERTKILYDELTMPDVYKEEKQKICDKIENEIAHLSDSRLSKLLAKVLDVTKSEDEVI